MRGFTVVVAATILLAGCAQAPAEAEPEDVTFDDVQVTVTETTGAILGVVVDETITPVAGVLVTLQGSEQSTITDDGGRFSFDGLDSGIYFLSTESSLHESIQFTAEVVAGVAEPDIIRVQVVSLYSGEPYVAAITHDGFFTCSQANFPGFLYSSSPCHSPAPGVDLCEQGGACLDQDREFHMDVDDGWQSIVYEMNWKSTAQGTSDRMGVVISTYKPERSGTHSFANYASQNPMWLELKTGEQHPSGAGEAPAIIPADGMKDVSYFTSVRPPADAACVIWCAPPGLALDQSFEIYIHQFYYLPAPEGWSIVNGDGVPY